MVRGATLLQAQRWAGTLTATFAFIACAVSGELGPVTMTLFPVGLVGSVQRQRVEELRLVTPQLRAPSTKLGNITKPSKIQN